ncbi:hypothetical protein HPB47_003992, partial [Ixodes persulcatus]
NEDTVAGIGGTPTLARGVRVRSQVTDSTNGPDSDPGRPPLGRWAAAVAADLHPASLMTAPRSRYPPGNKCRRLHVSLDVVIDVVLKIVLEVVLQQVLDVVFDIIRERPWHYWKKSRQRFGIQLDQSDPASPYVKAKTFTAERFPNVGTLNELMAEAFRKYSDRPCLGARPVLAESEEQKDGKVIKKLSLGDYEWLTYSDVDHLVDLISRAIITLGLKPTEYLGILAETRQEWILTALACIRVNVPLVTLYATLGEDGIIQALNETEVTHLVTSYDLMPRVVNVLCNTPLIKRIIYMESKIKRTPVVVPENVEVIPFFELERRGRTADADLKAETPRRDDVFIIMYTSGTTGIPKGVMITHKNIMATLKGFSVNCQTLGTGNDDSHIAYLPLAHILELLVECLTLGLGAKIGFSSALTLTDTSTGLKAGCLGDATLLKPVLLVCPPLILNRIRKSITDNVAAKGPFARFFEYLLAYKNFWLNFGFNTTILNHLVFNKMRALLGGRVAILATGAAPLSVDTDAFIRACFDCCPIQGYGLTETAGSAALKDLDDRNFKSIGSPTLGSYISAPIRHQILPSGMDRPGSRERTRIALSTLAELSYCSKGEGCLRPIEIPQSPRRQR